MSTPRLAGSHRCRFEFAHARASAMHAKSDSRLARSGQQSVRAAAGVCERIAEVARAAGLFAYAKPGRELGLAPGGGRAMLPGVGKIRKYGHLKN